MLLTFSIALLAGLTASVLLTPLVRTVARRYGLVVRPRDDRWHTTPTALYGGVAIALGAYAGIGVLVAIHGSDLASARTAVVVAVSAGLFVVGLADDARGLPPVGKLIWQIGAGALLVLPGLIISVTPWEPMNVLVTLLWFVGISNALNLLDNMDGAAAGVATVAAAGFGVLYVRAGDPVLAGVACAIAGGALGFLFFNFKPASIFMGDAGSLFLGAALAALGAAYSQSTGTNGPVALLIPVLVLLVPLVDTTLVTFARILHGRRISVGGRDHSTHRLVAMGFSERQTAVLLYIAGALSAIIAISIARAPTGIAVWLGALLLTGALVFAAYLGTLYQYDESDAVGRRSAVLRDVFLKRRGFVLLLDIVLFGAAYYGAFAFYYDLRLPARMADLAALTVGMVIVLKLIAFNYFNVYRAPWARTTLADIHQIVKATLFGSLLLISASFLIARGAQVPRTVFVLDLLLTGVLALAARASFQSLERFRLQLRAAPGVPSIIYAAPAEIELLLAAISARPELGLRPVAILTDDDEKVGEFVLGIPIVDSANGLRSIASDGGAQVLVCGTHALTGRLKDIVAEVGVSVMQFRAEFVPAMVPQNRTGAQAASGGVR